LNLGSLLEDSKKSLLQNLQQNIKSKVLKQPALAKHDKMLKKPGFNVLMDRYKSNPTDPILCAKGRLEKLADPLRGKYSNFDEIMSDEEDSSVNENRYKSDDVVLNSGSKKSPKKTLRSPEKLNHSPNYKGSQDIQESVAFFLTETAIEEEPHGRYRNTDFENRRDQAASRGDQVLTRVRQRLEEAAKLESNVSGRQNKGIL
jgi:hypothetical protein